MGNRRTWDGGYIHRQKDGRDLFILEKELGGQRFHISTRCYTATAAYEHLKRFQADPWRYREEMKSGRAEGERLVLTDALLREYHEWMLTRDRPKPATRKHANEMWHRLNEWAEDFQGGDLRKLRLEKLEAMLNGRKTSRQHRIIALKGFFGWLRTKKFLVERKDDPTLDLEVPQGEPEKHRRRKVVPAADVKKALAKLDALRRDCLIVRAHTGWHVTELERFIRSEDSRIAPGKGKVLAVLQTRHKSGDTTRTPVQLPAVLAAAKRLKTYGAMPRRINAALRRACLAAKVTPFAFGQIRHSVATWAIEAGTPAEDVAEFLGHKDKRTTLRFYADVGVPTVSVKLPKVL